MVFEIIAVAAGLQQEKQHPVLLLEEGLAQFYHN
jgi:hypothetical protein